ncbi:MAG: glycosyltransferase family A protein [Coleofasciculus sp. D1-CHI-01]|uniref:glycosyltransferase n=1 Tax=Coleofasciculus sp. D1-CHI-01 TaxID=3068482 RepID=UPI0032FBEB09
MSESQSLIESGLSVVIPTYKRVQMCETLLDSLKTSQAFCDIPTEVWVMDDSPTPDAQRIKAACDRHHFNYCWQSGPVTTKRNLGAKNARYPIVCFIDSDCIATPELLQRHCDCYHHHSEVVAVIGKTEFKGPQTWLWHVIELTPYLDAFAIADFPTQIVWGPSNNFSCRKTIFKQLGGFDENCPQPIGGEDAELGYRLYHEGYMMHTCPEAVVYHSTETWNTLPQVLQRLTRWSRGDIYLKRRNWISLYYSCPSRLGTVLILIPLAISISLTT